MYRDARHHVPKHNYIYCSFVLLFSGRMLIHPLRRVYMRYAIVFQFFEVFTYPYSCFKDHQMSAKSKRYLGMVCTKFMRSVFLRSLDRITRQQGLAGVTLKLSCA